MTTASRKTGPMDDTQLSTLIGIEMNNTLGGSVGTNDSELNKVWEKAMDYYFGRARGDEVKGRSTVISMDMADMIEQTMAQTLPAYDKKNLGTFSGENAEVAQNESDAINYLVLEENKGFIKFMENLKDSMLQRNGIAKVFVDERAEIEYETYEGINELLLPQLLQPRTPNESVEVTEQNIVQEPQFDEFSGQQLTPAVFDIQIKRKTTKKKLCVESVPPEEFAVNEDHHSIFLDDARFVRHTKIETESSLIAQGYDEELIKSLKTYTTSTESDQRARSRDSAEDEYDTSHHSNRNIQVDEIYFLIDYDGDGIAERRKILHSDGTIIDNEWFPCVPFAAGSCYLMPHRFWGLSYYDKLKQTQDIKTGFLRKTLDNAEGLINQRVIAINGQVNMGDLLSSRPTGVVRAKTQGAVTPFPVQNMGDTGFRMLTYMDKVRKEAAGAQLDIGTSENVPVAGQTAHGMERWMTSKEHLPALIAKLFAETLIRGVYELSHKLVKRYMPEGFSYRVNGEQQQAQPSQWNYDDKLIITIDTTETDKQKQYQSLDIILNQQIRSIEQGAGLTTMTHIHNTLSDQVKLAGFDNPGRYWVDPTSEEGKQIAQKDYQNAQKNKMEAQAESDKLYNTEMATKGMSEETKRMIAMMKDRIESDEQFRKWVELEFDFGKDVPGKGLEGKVAANG